MRVLVAVGADDSLSAMLDLSLRARGLQPVEGEEDLIVLGHQRGAPTAHMLQNMRAAGDNTPVVIVSPVADVPSIVACLNAGADDYLVTPFHLDELHCRIEAVMRRDRGRAEAVLRRDRGRAEAVLRCGPLTLDRTHHKVMVGSREVHLTRKHFEMLEALALKKGLAVTYAQLLQHMYGEDAPPSRNILNVMACNLRKRLRIHGCDSLIRCVWGLGFQMVEPEAA